MPVEIIDTLRAKNGAPFPVADAADVRGCPRPVPTREAMAALPEHVRAVGMTVHCLEDGGDYRLQADGSWRRVGSGEGGTPCPPCQDGDDGQSAYELAVEAGFDGDLQQWLDSLKGDPGATDFAGLSGAPADNPALAAELLANGKCLASGVPMIALTAAAGVTATMLSVPLPAMRAGDQLTVRARTRYSGTSGKTFQVLLSPLTDPAAGTAYWTLITATQAGGHGEVVIDWEGDAAQSGGLYLNSAGAVVTSALSGALCVAFRGKRTDAADALVLKSYEILLRRPKA